MASTNSSVVPHVTISFGSTGMDDEPLVVVVVIVVVGFIVVFAKGGSERKEELLLVVLCVLDVGFRSDASFVFLSFSMMRLLLLLLLLCMSWLSLLTEANNSNDGISALQLQCWLRLLRVTRRISTSSPRLVVLLLLPPPRPHPGIAVGCAGFTPMFVINTHDDPTANKQPLNRVNISIIIILLCRSRQTEATTTTTNKLSLGGWGRRRSNGAMRCEDYSMLMVREDRYRYVAGAEESCTSLCEARWPTCPAG